MSVVVWAVVSFFLGSLVAGTAVFFLSNRNDRQQPSIDYETVIDSLEDPLVLVNTDGTVQLTNTAFESQFEHGMEGRHIEDVFADHAGIRERIEERNDGIVTVPTDNDDRHLEICTTPLGEDSDRRLVAFHDVTGQHHRRQQLEERNEQLDQFASLVSHDLRNPLDVAIGRTNAIAELNEDSRLDQHVESLDDSLDRMHRIITDVLTLTRQGKHVGDKAELSLAAVANDAWSHVQTESATLDVETAIHVVADRDALEHVFENLFRNAVEHGHAGPHSKIRDDDLTVRVGSLENNDGFFVADDGVGISPEKHDEYLEAGKSGDDGTGLGLAIVANVADAHGWELTIADSESGGARFEFSGVELGRG